MRPSQHPNGLPAAKHVPGAGLGRVLAAAVALVMAATVVLPPAAGIAASASWNAGPHPLEGPEVVLQSLPYSCGPAVLATLTTWFGAPRSESELIAAASMSAEGVTLSEFARLAHAVGLPGAWYAVPVTDVHGVPAPFVAHLAVAEAGAGLGHLVAVAAVSHGYVVVADPAVGTYVQSIAAFARGYSGRVYVLGGRS